MGSQVVSDLSNTGDTLYSGYHTTKPSSGNQVFIDLADDQKIKSAVSRTRPDAIIHLAAMTNVDLCETEKELAIKLNAHATETLASLASSISAFFVYVSTDYVFDGEQGMKKESDAPNPIGNYGKSKLEGEKAVKDTASEWCIARISTPYGVHPTKKTFPIWVLDNLKNKKEINVVTDQFTSPTYVPNLSSMLMEITKKKIQGILHVSGSDRISRYDMAELVAQKMNLDNSMLKKISVDEIQWKAKRPKDSSLDVSKAASILNEKPMGIQMGLEKLLKEIRS